MVCTGNVGNNADLQMLRDLSSAFHMVLGEGEDIEGMGAKKKIDVNGVKIGIIHGHQVELC